MTNVNSSETNGTTLLPCPFCGGEAATHEVGFPYHYWDVWCDGECFDHFCEAPTEAEAIATWNRRAERTCHVELNESKTAVICSHCGSTDPLKDWSTFKGWGGETRIDAFTTYPYCPNCGRRVVSE